MSSNKASVVFVLTVFAVGMLTAAYRFQHYLPFLGPDFVGECEEALKDRLKAPSSYERVEVTLYEDPMSVERYLAFRDGDSYEPYAGEVERLSGDGKALTLHVAFISYDAKNAFGVPLRRLAKCEFASEDGDLREVSAANVRIDGQTNHERIVKSVLGR